MEDLYLDMVAGAQGRFSHAAESGSINDVFDLEAAHMMRTFMTDDHKQAVHAFIKKEPPVFRGK